MNTNIKYVSNNRVALIFDDHTICPICGNKIELEKKKLIKTDINIKYICKKCGFSCPIKWENNKKPVPLYDDQINKVIDSIGKRKTIKALIYDTDDKYNEYNK